MSTSGDQDVIDRATRTSQIIIGSLTLGVVVFLGVATVIDMRPNAGARPGGGANPAQAQGKPANAQPNAPAAADLDTGTLLTWMAVAFAAVTLPLSFVIPGLVTQQSRRAIASGTWSVTKGGSAVQPRTDEAFPTDASKLATVYQTQLIIGAALNEGPTFFAAIAYLIGKNPIALGLGILLVGGLIARFPTRDRVARWIDRQEEQLILDKQAAI